MGLNFKLKVSSESPSESGCDRTRAGAHCQCQGLPAPPGNLEAQLVRPPRKLRPAPRCLKLRRGAAAATRGGIQSVRKVEWGPVPRASSARRWPGGSSQALLPFLLADPPVGTGRAVSSQPAFSCTCSASRSQRQRTRSLGVGVAWHVRAGREGGDGVPAGVTSRRRQPRHSLPVTTGS